jgi:hypothetical protein
MFGVQTVGAETPMAPRLPAGSIRQGPVKSLCVGIDFGTARSGYAYAYGSDNIPQLQVRRTCTAGLHT